MTHARKAFLKILTIMVIQKCNVTYFLSRKEFKQNRFISKVHPDLQRIGDGNRYVPF